MRLKKVKDNNYRQYFKQTELFHKSLKYLSKNVTFLKSHNKNPYWYLLRLNSKGSFTKIMNRCIFTSRAHSVFKNFKMSRLVFKKEALKGSVIGVRKSSW